jgi:hypothetical protein
VGQQLQGVRRELYYVEVVLVEQQLLEGHEEVAGEEVQVDEALA